VWVKRIALETTEKPDAAQRQANSTNTREPIVITRRQILKAGAAAGAAAGLTWGIRRAYPFAQSPTNIRKFVVNLPGLGPSGANQIEQYIPLATKTTMNFAGLSTDVYKLGVAQFGEKMHPDLPRATLFWGYYDLATADQKYLAGVIVAKRGTPVLLNVTNQLPNKELIPVDPTIEASPTQTVGQLPFNRIATHLHGGFTPWFSDGTPFQWFTPGGQRGASFMNVPGTNPPAGTATYYYPMDQSARFVWYHDHAIGITRTNAYAGIASALLLTDDFESGLVTSGLLPDLVGIPLVIQDKTFVPDNILTQDPTWQWGQSGRLWYPHVYEPTSVGGTGPNPSCADNPKGRWDYGPCATPKAVLPSNAFYTLPTPASVVAEAFFDTTLINGGIYPVVSVPPKRVGSDVERLASPLLSLESVSRGSLASRGSTGRDSRTHHVPGRHRGRLPPGSGNSQQYYSVADRGDGYRQPRRTVQSAARIRRARRCRHRLQWHRSRQELHLV
jgi:FtsP/CotA-like multicopper oxidase with cupredoxin domain